LSQRSMIGRCKLDLFGSGLEPFSGFCEAGAEQMGSIKSRMFLD